MPRVGEEFILKTNLSCGDNIEHFAGDKFLFCGERIDNDGILSYTLKPEDTTINLSCAVKNFEILFTNKKKDREEKIKSLLS